MIKLISALCLLLLPFVRSTVAEQFGVSVVVRQETTVAKGTVQLGDIADVHSLEPSHDELAARLEGQEIAGQIAPSQIVSLSADELLALLKPIWGGASVGYRIPSKVLIRRASVELPPAALLPTLREALRLPDAKHIDFEVSMVPPLVVPTGSLVFRFKPHTPWNGGNVDGELTVISQDGEEFIYRPSIRVVALEERPVAARSLVKGVVLQASDVTTARFPVRQVANSPLSLDGLVGMELSSSVVQGAEILPTMVRPPVVVKKGQRLVATTLLGNLTATARVTSLSDGRVGDIVRVRNDTSLKVIEGRVVSQDAIMIVP